MVETTEQDTTDQDAGPVATPRGTRRHKVPTPLLWLVVIVVGTAAVVGLTVTLMPTPHRAADRPADAGTIAVQQAPQLSVMQLGQAQPGCMDQRSHADALVLCPGDLDSTWGYDGGVVQPQGAASDLPACTNAVMGPSVAWVDVNNGLTNVHEDVATQPSAAAALATIARLSRLGGAQLCSNLSPGGAARVAPVSIAFPGGAASGVAFSVPATGRTYDVVFVAVRQGVLRLDVTALGSTPAGPPTGVVQRVVNAAVARYLIG